MNVGRSWILPMGPVGFAPTMACSVSMVYFTMVVWWFRGCLELPLGADLGISCLILRVLRSDGGGCMALIYCSLRSAVCVDNSGRGMCQSLCLAVLTADIEVLEGWFQNQQVLVITSLIHLWGIGSVYLWLRFARMCVRTIIFAYFVR